MMDIVLAGAAGFLAGVLVMLLAGLLRLSHVGGTAGDRAKGKATEFTQLLVLSDGGLMWIITIGYMVLAAYAIYKGYQGALPWLTGTPAAAFAGWSTVRAFLIKKSEKQNTTGGITYDTAMAAQAQKEDLHGKS